MLVSSARIEDITSLSNFTSLLSDFGGVAFKSAFLMGGQVLTMRTEASSSEESTGEIDGYFCCCFFGRFFAFGLETMGAAGVSAVSAIFFLVETLRPDGVVVDAAKSALSPRTAASVALVDLSAIFGS